MKHDHASICGRLEELPLNKISYCATNSLLKGTHQKGYVPQCTHFYWLLSSLRSCNQDYKHHADNFSYLLQFLRKQQLRWHAAANTEGCKLFLPQCGWIQVGGDNTRTYKFFITSTFPSKPSLCCLYGIWVTCVPVGEGLLGSCHLGRFFFFFVLLPLETALNLQPHVFNALKFFIDLFHYTTQLYPRIMTHKCIIKLAW